MISKLLLIKNVGKLAEVAFERPFRRLTLVYGENASGKSTLAAVLRSLKDGDSAELEERQTVDGCGSPQVELLVNDSPHRFRDGKWDRVNPSVYVFDGTFVDRNVYSGFEVSATHRENLMSFALGEEAVRLQSKMEKQAAQVNALGGEIKAAESAIGQHASPLTVDDFIALPKDEEAESKIAGLRARIRAIEDKQAVHKRPLPVRLPTQSLPEEEDISHLLAEGVDDLLQASLALVEAHVAHLGVPTARDWLQAGTGLSKGDLCPYCGQDTSGTKLVQAMKAYFGEAYADLRSRIGIRANQVRVAGEPKRFTDLVVNVKQNAAAIAMWPELQQVSSEVTEAATRLPLDATPTFGNTLLSSS